MHRPPFEFTILASAARTATTNTDPIVNPGFQGLQVILVATAITATPIVSNCILAVPNQRAVIDWSTLYTADWTDVTATTHWAHAIFHPHVAAVAGIVTSVVSSPVPQVFRLTFTHTDADSITYSVIGRWMP